MPEMTIQERREKNAAFLIKIIGMVASFDTITTAYSATSMSLKVESSSDTDMQNTWNTYLLAIGEIACSLTALFLIMILIPYCYEKDPSKRIVLPSIWMLLVVASCVLSSVGGALLIYKEILEKNDNTKSSDLHIILLVLVSALIFSGQFAHPFLTAIAPESNCRRITPEEVDEIQKKEMGYLSSFFSNFFSEKVKLDRNDRSNKRDESAGAGVVSSNDTIVEMESSDELEDFSAEEIE